MVVGESGLGKSTLVNSLFLTDLYPERIIPDAVGKHYRSLSMKLLFFFKSILLIYFYIAMLYSKALLTNKYFRSYREN